MSEVQNPSWNQRAFDVVRQFCTGYATEITGQQLRAKLASVIGEPPTPNAFGPFVAWLARSGAIEKTDRKVPMTGRENHGRLTPVYLI